MTTDGRSGGVVGPALLWFDRRLRHAENACAVLAACAAFLAMILVSLDAILRHLFANPLTFQHYLTEKYLLVGLLLLALPWGYRTGGYIRVNVLPGLLAPRPAQFLIRGALLMSAAYVGYLAFAGAGDFERSLLRGETEMGVIDWPVAWSLFFVPIGAGLLALRLLVDAVGPEDLMADRAPRD